MAIDNDKLLAAIDAASENSYGSDDGSELSARREAAIRAYIGDNVDPAPAGRSQVVDRTLFEVIESCLPSLVRIFASGDDVVRVLPVGPDDQDAADQTTALLQWTVTEKNPWEQISHDWFKDSLLLANGYAMAYWDESERIERETYEGQSDEQLALLMQDDNVRILQHSQRPDEDTDKRNAEGFQRAQQQWQMMAAQAQQQAMQTGQPPQMPPPPQPPQPAFLHDVVLERVENEGKVCIEVLPPEHCRVSVNAADFTLKTADYFETWSLKSVSELRSMGLDVDDWVNDSEDKDTLEDSARDRFAEDWRRQNPDTEPAMRKVRTRMVWVKTAAEDDDIARMYYAVVVGRTVLYAEPCTRIPVASITPMPMPHRHIGLGMWDILEDIQQTKQAVIRSALDNLYLSVNGRTVVSDQVNLEDLLDVRPGGVVRMNSGALPAEGHVLPLNHPFAFDSIIGTLSYFDQARQNISGVNAYFNGVDQGALNRTATGLSLMTTQSAQRVEQIARMFAIGVEYLFSCVLELIQKHANKAQTFALRGKWYAVDPLAWSKKRDLKIAVGVGAGNKDAMLAHLNAMLAQQMQIGMPLAIADRTTVYNTASEIAKLQGFAQTERFWKDPSQTPPPQPQPPLPLMLEQQKQQAEMQRAQVAVAAEQAESQLDAQVKAMELEHKARMDAMQLEFDRWKTEFDASVKLQIAAMQEDKTTEREITKIGASQQLEGIKMQREDAKAMKDAEAEDVVGQTLAAIGQQVQQLSQVLATSRVAGIEKLRGPDGRMIGARIKRANGEVEDVPIQ
jgi:hypothetical protein